MGGAISLQSQREARRRALLLSLALWSFMLGLLWKLGAISGLPEQVDPVHFWATRLLITAFALALGWIVFTILEWVIAKDQVNPLVALCGLVLVFGTLHTQTSGYLFHLFTGLERPLRSQVNDIIYWLHFQFAWGVLVLTLLVGARVQSEREARNLAEREAHSAELEALRFQIHPHFLFNSLAAVSNLISEGRYQSAERMIRMLSAFLRSGLGRDALEDVRLEEEIDDLMSYAEVEMVRFADRFQLRLDIDPGAASALIPSFLLQPLLENSIKYAVARSTDPITIELSAQIKGEVVEIVLQDDGPGSTGTLGLGTGEANVAARLRARFGDPAKVTSGDRSPEPGGARGYRVTLRFPIETEQTNAS